MGMRRRQDFKGCKVLITAGPTREYIDPVRFLSNPSTGKMGFALAELAARRGAAVTLISGPTELATPKGVRRVDVVSAREMSRATLKASRGKDIIIMSAAVADYRPQRPATQKIKKASGKALQLKLVRTEDILATLGRKKNSKQYLVGFAAETRQLIKNARKKLCEKNLDLIVANPVGRGRGFAVDRNQATLLFSDGRSRKLAPQTKRRLADRILNQISSDRTD
jgi:phosphopantothenoylcysteine decarboxylase/phosphopantothenate--cysteine ligase